MYCCEYRYERVNADSMAVSSTNFVIVNLDKQSESACNRDNGAIAMISRESRRDPVEDDRNPKKLIPCATTRIKNRKRATKSTNNTTRCRVEKFKLPSFVFEFSCFFKEQIPSGIQITVDTTTSQ